MIIFGRKRISELEQEIVKYKEAIVNKTWSIVNLERELRHANEAMDLLSSQPVISEPITEVITEPLAWISGEPKDTGWYFVATGEWAEPGYYTTALFYNPAARCRWMRGEKGNAERFEREVIAYIETPEYK